MQINISLFRTIGIMMTLVKIAVLNDLIKDYAEKNGYIYFDYYTAMVDERMGLKEEYTNDGVHPKEKVYMVMAPLAVKAIEEALLKIKN